MEASLFTGWRGVNTSGGGKEKNFGQHDVSNEFAMNHKPRKYPNKDFEPQNSFADKFT